MVFNIGLGISMFFVIFLLTIIMSVVMSVSNLLQELIMIQETHLNVYKKFVNEKFEKESKNNELYKSNWAHCP